MRTSTNPKPIAIDRRSHISRQLAGADSFGGCGDGGLVGLGGDAEQAIRSKQGGCLSRRAAKSDRRTQRRTPTLSTTFLRFRGVAPFPRRGWAVEWRLAELTNQTENAISRQPRHHVWTCRTSRYAD